METSESQHAQMRVSEVSDPSKVFQVPVSGLKRKKKEAPSFKEL